MPQDGATRMTSTPHIQDTGVSATGPTNLKDSFTKAADPIQPPRTNENDVELEDGEDGEGDDFNPQPSQNLNGNAVY